MRSGPLPPAAIDDVLRRLPGRYVVAGHGEARFVVGPTGAFVMLSAPLRAPAITDAVAAVNDLASLTRRHLCDHLTLVPFLDTLLIGANRLVRRPDVTVAPLDLLLVALTEGPQVIQVSSLNAINLAVRAGRLGDWRMAGTDATARIDLCDHLSTVPESPLTTR